MSDSPLHTRNLILKPQTREDMRDFIEQMPPSVKEQLSPAWLALFDGSSQPDPWVHGFRLLHRDSENVVGQCGFKGPPDADGMVEIAYGVNPEEEGKGYATEAAQALTGYAFSHQSVRLVRAHTLPLPNASTRVLTKCGFFQVGEVTDPEDGLVWRWEKPDRPANAPLPSGSPESKPR